MALTSEYMENARWQSFLFYQTYGTNGKADDSFCPEKPWKLGEIRIHFSTAFISNQYLIISLSSILGSAHNVVFYSLNCSGSTDIFIHYSEPLTFLSGDHLKLVLSMTSGLNNIGFQFRGWAVIN